MWRSEVNIMLIIKSSTIIVSSAPLSALEYYNELTEELILSRIEAEMGMDAKDCSELLAKLVALIKLQ